MQVLFLIPVIYVSIVQSTKIDGIEGEFTCAVELPECVSLC